MSTTYEDTPSLYERILGADLMLVGTVVRLVEVRPSEPSERQRVFGFFEVEVEEVIKGDQVRSPILVRVLGEQRKGGAEWIVRLEEGSRLLFLVTPDVAPGLPKNLFAPYFASAFAIDEGERVQVPADAVDPVSKRVARFERTKARLSGLRRLARHAQEERDRQRTELELLASPAVLRRRYPKTLEQPGVEPFREEPVAPGLLSPELAPEAREAEVQRPRARAAKRRQRRKT